jgi:predicted HAD superfamily phosphohydrolase
VCFFILLFLSLGRKTYKCGSAFKLFVPKIGKGVHMEEKLEAKSARVRRLVPLQKETSMTVQM